MKTFLIIALLAALAGCENKGLHTGSTLKDCGAIPANQREDAARAIKGLSGDAAVQALVDKFLISPEAAKQCLK